MYYCISKQTSLNNFKKLVIATNAMNGKLTIVVSDLISSNTYFNKVANYCEKTFAISVAYMM